MREDRGEIEAARQRRTLPRARRAERHPRRPADRIPPTSDGRDGLEAMAEAAGSAGLRVPRRSPTTRRRVAVVGWARPRRLPPPEAAHRRAECALRAAHPAQGRRGGHQPGRHARPRRCDAGRARRRGGIDALRVRPPAGGTNAPRVARPVPPVGRHLRPSDRPIADQAGTVRTSTSTPSAGWRPSAGSCWR